MEHLPGRLRRVPALPCSAKPAAPPCPAALPVSASGPAAVLSVPLSRGAEPAHAVTPHSARGVGHLLSCLGLTGYAEQVSLALFYG